MIEGTHMASSLINIVTVMADLIFVVLGGSHSEARRARLTHQQHKKHTKPRCCHTFHDHVQTTASPFVSDID